MPPAANRSRKRQRPQLATEPHSEATALATTSPNLPTNTDASDEVISESPQYTNMQSHTNDHNNERNFIFQQHLIRTLVRQTWVSNLFSGITPKIWLAQLV